MPRFGRPQLQLVLAWLWLFDGALSLQHALLGRDLVTTVLLPAAEHQPAWVAAPIHTLTSLVQAAPLPWGLAIAGVQLVLGIGLAGAKHPGPWLAASIAWALSIWWLGEGLGGVFQGATILDGAPGAALLYALAAVLAWPSSTTSNLLPRRLTVWSWSTLWIGAAMLQVTGGNLAPAALGQAASAAEMGAPSWVAAIDARLATIDGRPITIALVAIEVLVALWSLVPGAPQRVAIGIGMTVALVGWVALQGAGDLTSGMATDPNTGPLILLLGLCALSVVRAPREAVASPTTSSLREYQPRLDPLREPASSRSSRCD